MNIEPDMIIDCLNQLMSKKKISIYKLARKAQVSESTIHNIVNRGNYPTLATLIKLCNGLDISVSEFFCILQGPSDDYYSDFRDYFVLSPEKRYWVRVLIQLFLLD